MSGLINFISALFFGTFVYFKNKKSLVNKTFALLSFATALWGFGYWRWFLAGDEPEALFWVHILSFGATLIPIFYLHWILALLDLHKKKRMVLMFGYTITFLLLLFSMSSLYVKDMEPKLLFSFWPIAGPLYLFYIVVYLLLSSYGCYQLIKIYKKVDGHKRSQIKYVLFGSLVGFAGGATNFPLWYGIKILPIGNPLVAFYPFILAYAIVKHRLMGIKIVFAGLLVVIISFLFLFDILMLPQSFSFRIVKGLVFGVFLYLGYALIQSVQSEQKARENLEIAYADLKKLDEAKSEFVSIASHQLRTPLTAIKGYISMMLEKTYGEPPEKMTKPLENIYLSNERLIKLVNGLLNISRIEAGGLEMHPEKVFLGEVITSVVGELESGAKNKNIYLKFEKPKEPLPKILVDVEKIREAIMNLIDNAIRYTNKGGVTIKCKIQNEKCIIEITDTGEGMTKEEITHLFESFSRGTAGTRFWTEGAGLGLYVAKKFVEMHDGKIWAESKGKDKGSTFYIELPIKS